MTQAHSTLEAPEEVVEVELDSRQRLPMARIINGSQHRFRVTKLPTGELLLTPVVSISERELAMLRNPERMAQLAEGIRQAAAGEVSVYDVGTDEDDEDIEG